MFKFLLKRMVTVFIVLLGSSFLTFAMMNIAPGNAATEIALARYGEESFPDESTIKWIIRQQGLDQPFLIRYFHWIKKVVSLDLGKSLVEEKPVAGIIANRFRKTLELAAAAILISILISIPLGYIAGIKQGRWPDYWSSTFAVLGVSIPNYWLGFILILVFSVKLKLLPGFGYGGWQYILLPAVTLGTAITAYTTRILRVSTIRVMNADFMLSLRARGVSRPLILAAHIAKNTILPVITVIGFEFGMLLEGAVMTETVFAWPGIGDLLIAAIRNRDYPLIQGIVLLSAAIFVAINFIVDVVHLFLDPRIKTQ